MSGGANPNNVTTASNPYEAAAMAQRGAMASTAAGLNRTAASGMSAYQNPYETQVVEATLRDVGSQAQMGMNNLAAQAQQAKAFGGSRHGIAMGELGKSFNQQAMDQAAKLRAAGFNTALGAAQTDISNQSAAANQLASLGQQAFNYGQTIQDQQYRQGTAQQALIQSLIDASKGQYAGYTGSPADALSILISSLTGATTGASAMAGETSTYNPGLIDYLQVGADVMSAMKPTKPV